MLSFFALVFQVARAVSVNKSGELIDCSAVWKDMESLVLTVTGCLAILSLLVNNIAPRREPFSQLSIVMASSRESNLRVPNLSLLFAYGTLPRGTICACSADSLYTTPGTPGT